MAYNTGNPVGSTDPRDLYDNAPIFDKYVNGEEPFVADRLGRQRLSISGQNEDFQNAQDGRESAFQEFLAASSFVFIGDYAAELNITSRSQYIIRDGVAYRLATSATLPYVTTGNWATEAVNFSPISSDDILRQDLANGSEIAKGATLVAEKERTVSEFLNDEINVLAYIPKALHASIRDGSIRDNPVDLAPYIQSALQAARGPGMVTRLRLRGVYCPSGFYPTSTFYVPEGVILRGAGACETTSANATQFIQFGDADVIRFAGHFSGDRYWWFGRIQDFTVYGKLSASAGYGIHFREAGGEMITPQDTSCMRDVIVRFCKQGGIRFPYGGLPMDVSTVKIKDCEGPGISITGGAGSIQSFVLYQPSIDRCGSEAILIENHDNRGSITIINPKFEGGLNPDVNVNAVRQRVGIRLRNFDEGAPITVIGGTHIMAADQTEKPGDFIVVEGAGTPHLDWSGIQVRIAAGQVGADPSVVSSTDNAVAVPYSVKTGSLSNSHTVHRSTLSTRKTVLGNTDDYRATSVEGTAYQVAGLTPGYSLFETDAGADAKAWLMVASNGSLTMRSVNDTGAATVFMQVQRTAGAATKVEWAVPQKPGNYAKAQLPTAASMANCISTVSDPTAGKGRLVYSDGVAWRYVSDDTAV